MRRRDVALGLVCASATLAIAGKAEAAASESAAKLEAQIRQLAESYSSAWNAADMDAMSALYTPDVHWVNIVGMHWQGWAAVDKAHRAFFDRMFKGVPMKLEDIESISALPGGGAVAVLRWSVGAFKTPAGALNPPSRDRMTLVLVPAGDRLKIMHGANIQIVEGAQRSNPIQ